MGAYLLCFHIYSIGAVGVPCCCCAVCTARLRFPNGPIGACMELGQECALPAAMVSPMRMGTWCGGMTCAPLRKRPWSKSQCVRFVTPVGSTIEWIVKHHRVDCNLYTYLRFLRSCSLSWTSLECIVGCMYIIMVFAVCWLVLE